MEADTVSESALPLLAFALREMWDRFGASGSFTLGNYVDGLGGLNGALARAAEALCDERSLSAADLRRLRAALLRLVRVDAEGRFVRQPRRWDELPPEVYPLLERFVQARLLVARDDGGARVVEVAHEALFRAWDRLVVWLNADRDFLLWRERLRNARAEWQRNGEDRNLLLRGPLLAEAARWDKERGDELDDTLRSFIAASVAASELDRDARLQQRRRLRLAAVGAMLLIGFAAWAWWQQYRLGLAGQLSAEAAQTTVLPDRINLTLDSLKHAWTADAHQMLFEELAHLARPVSASWKPHPGPVLAMALSPEGRWLATAGIQGLQVQSRDGAARDLHSDNHDNTLNAVAFSVDGHWLAAACAQGRVCIYDTGNWQMVKERPHPGRISTLAFSRGRVSGHDGEWLAIASHQSPVVKLVAVPTWEEQAGIETGVNQIWSVAFHPDGTRIAVAGGGTEIWRIDGARPVNVYRGQGGGSNQWTAFSRDGNDLAVGNRLVKDVNSPKPTLVERSVASSNTRCGGFSRDGELRAVCTGSNFGVEVWRSDTWSVSTTHAASAIAFGEGRRIVQADSGGRILAWDPDGLGLRTFVHEKPVHAVALAPDGRLLATASGDGLLRLFDTDKGSEHPQLKFEGEVAALAFSADGRWLAVQSDRNSWVIDMNDWRVVPPIVHDEEIARTVFGPDSRNVATVSFWGGVQKWGPERKNESSQLRVWDLPSRSERASAFVFTTDPRRGSFRLEPGKADDASAAAVASITRGDAALADRARAWFAAAAEPAPSVKWLQAQTSAGNQRVYEAAQKTVERAMGAGESPIKFAFSADGRLMASSHGNEVRLWQMKPEDLVAEVCARVPQSEKCGH